MIVRKRIRKRESEKYSESDKESDEESEKKKEQEKEKEYSIFEVCVRFFARRIFTMICFELSLETR